jgi:hypothetical protein
MQCTLAVSDIVSDPSVHLAARVPNFPLGTVDIVLAHTSLVSGCLEVVLDDVKCGTFFGRVGSDSKNFGELEF